MKILILWADDRSPNLGVRVLAAGARHLASAAFPDAEITMQDFRESAAGVALDREAILADMSRRGNAVAQVLDGIDLVLDTGAGDSFTDIYGLGRLWILTYVRRAARRRGIPVVLMPQTVGPFGSRVSRMLGRYGLAGVETVVTRDPVSSAHARNVLRRPVVESTDVVFALPAVSRSVGRDVLLNVSGLLWNGRAGASADNYQAAILDIVGRLEAEGRTVSLLAHVLANQTVDDDVRVMPEVVRRVGHDLEVVVPEDLPEAREVIASAQLLIGARMHACLNALSIGTPAVAMAYSRKFEPLLDSLGWRHSYLADDASQWASAVASAAGTDFEPGDVAAVAARGRERLAGMTVVLRESRERASS
ncbi:polysaccharide pyruvyl transferase family protein [Cellulomonas sp.]|uniref:polysaccharide pyruvyl transferase family protein n=1 Tax=Cellulomonas sp. TaxID=40001 RepID=UPI003BAA1934